MSRGAVIQGLTGLLQPVRSVQVGSRVARASYGTLQYENYDPDVHDRRDRAWSDEEAGWVAVDQPVWFIKYVSCTISLRSLFVGHPSHCKPNQGDVVVREPTVRFEFYNLHSVSHDVPTTHEVTVFHSTDVVAPTRLTQSVKELCTIKWTIQPRRFRNIVKNQKGERRYALCFDVEMSVHSAGLEFAVIVNGQKMAAENVSVQYAAADSSPKTLGRPPGATESRDEGPQSSPQRQRGSSGNQLLPMTEAAQTPKRKRDETVTPALDSAKKRRVSRAAFRRIKQENADDSESYSWGSSWADFSWGRGSG